MNLDLERMSRALQLARRGLYSTHPNPRVGCVVTSADGEMVGEGWHVRAGEPHAEVYALRQAGERAREALACAVVYARVRGLSVSLPAQVTRYRLNQAGLCAFQEQYHALWMPPQIWTTARFMHLLLENHIPYARLAKLHPDYQEVLLLPRGRRRSNALGLGLLKAGAFDAVEWFAKLVAAQAPVN